MPSIAGRSPTSMPRFGEFLLQRRAVFMVGVIRSPVAMRACRRVAVSRHCRGDPIAPQMTRTGRPPSKSIGPASLASTTPPTVPRKKRHVHRIAPSFMFGATLVAATRRCYDFSSRWRCGFAIKVTWVNRLRCLVRVALALLPMTVLEAPAMAASGEAVSISGFLDLRESCSWPVGERPFQRSSHCMAAVVFTAAMEPFPPVTQIGRCGCNPRVSSGCSSTASDREGVDSQCGTKGRVARAGRSACRRRSGGHDLLAGDDGTSKTTPFRSSVGRTARRPAYGACAKRL